MQIPYTPPDVTWLNILSSVGSFLAGAAALVTIWFAWWAIRTTKKSTQENIRAVEESERRSLLLGLYREMQEAAHEYDKLDEMYCRYIDLSGTIAVLVNEEYLDSKEFPTLSDSQNRRLDSAIEFARNETQDVTSPRLENKEENLPRDYIVRKTRRYQETARFIRNDYKWLSDIVKSTEGQLKHAQELVEKKRVTASRRPNTSE